MTDRLADLHCDRAARSAAAHAEDDLHVVTLAIARVAARGQLTAAPSQPGGGQVVQKWPQKSEQRFRGQLRA